MTSTLTTEQQQAISDYLRNRHIPQGIGTAEAACSIAAINLALTGELTDRIPYCMSPVIGRWIIYIQDAMPDSIRNSDEWRTLLPLAAGTGRDREGQRLQIIMNWMWSTVLPTIQPIADKHGFGLAWETMCKEKTSAAAAAAAAAAEAAAEARARRAARAARAAAWAAARAAAAAAEAWAAAVAARYDYFADELIKLLKSAE